MLAELALAAAISIATLPLEPRDVPATKPLAQAIVRLKPNETRRVAIRHPRETYGFVCTVSSPVGAIPDGVSAYPLGEYACYVTNLDDVPHLVRVIAYETFFGF